MSSLINWSMKLDNCLLKSNRIELDVNHLVLFFFMDIQGLEPKNI